MSALSLETASKFLSTARRADKHSVVPSLQIQPPAAGFLLGFIAFAPGPLRFPSCPQSRKKAVRRTGGDSETLTIHVREWDFG